MPQINAALLARAQEQQAGLRQFAGAVGIQGGGVDALLVAVRVAETFQVGGIRHCCDSAVLQPLELVVPHDQAPIGSAVIAVDDTVDGHPPCRHGCDRERGCVE